MGWKILPVSVLLVVAVVQCERTPRCELRVARTEWAAFTCVPVDVNRDGTDELYWVNDWCERVDALDSKPIHFGGSPVPKKAYQVIAFAGAAADSGGSRRLVVAVTEAESLYVMSDTLCVTVHRLPPRGSDGGRWDVGWGQSAAFADLDRDGDLEVVLSVESGYMWRLAGRGVRAVDLDEGRVLWSYGLGPAVANVVTSDLDGDGRTEVLLGTSAVHNGCVENGTADSNAYVVCLNDSGRKVWQTTIRENCEGTVTRVAAGDIDGDGQKEVVVAEERGAAGGSAGAVLLLDAANGQVARRRSAQTILHGLLVEDLGSDGTAEIVLASDSAVQLLDGDLKVRRSGAVAGGVERLIACGSLLGNKDKQVILLTRAGSIVLIDKNLKTLVSREYPRRVESVKPVSRGTGNPMSLLVTSDAYVPGSPQSNHQLLQVEVLPRPFPWRELSAGLAALLVFGAGFTVYLRRQSRLQFSSLTRGLVRRAGVVELDRSGKVVAANDYAKDILNFPEQWEGVEFASLLRAVGLAPLKDALGRVLGSSLHEATAEVTAQAGDAVKTLRARVSRVRSGGGYFVSLEDMSAVEYARKVGAWGPVAQRLAHGIKTPLSTIRLTAQAMEGADPEGSKVIEEEVDRLAKMTDGFMRLADFEPPRLESKDINAVVQRVLDELGIASLPGIELKLELAEGLPQVQLDEEQVVRAMGNLVNNAVGAMGGKGRLAVGTRQAESAAEVVVAVMDSGPGIPPDYLAKLFQPFFTRKAGGTGLGLTIVRKVAEDHGGRVEVESEPGNGATFRLILPIPKPVA